MKKTHPRARHAWHARLSAGVTAGVILSGAALSAQAQNSPGQTPGAETAAPKLSVKAPASSVAVRKRAVKLMNAGKFQEACDVLTPAQTQFPDDMDVRFLLGQCALETDKPEVAVTQFEAMLAVNPNLPRVRLELARAYTQTRKFDQAREQFSMVMATNPPPAVGDNIQKFLDMIEAQRSWNVRLSLGFVSDSNVNTGPGSSSVLSGGNLTSQTVTGRSDNAWNLVGSFNHLHVLDKALAWQSDVSMNLLDYRSENASDLFMVSLSSGPTWRQGPYTVSAPLVHDRIRIADKPYSTSWGLAPQFQYAYDPDLQFNAGLAVSAREQDQANALDRTGRVYGLNGGARINLGEYGQLMPGLRIGRERTREDAFDNDSLALSLGYLLPLPQSLTLFVQPSWTRTAYDAADAFLIGQCSGCESVRKDDQYQLTANLAKSFGKSGLSAALGYTWTRNDSNVGLSDYKRQQVTLMLTWVY